MEQVEDYLGVEVATDSLLSPRLVVKLCSSLFFWVPYHICHGLGTEKQLDKTQLVQQRRN